MLAQPVFGCAALSRGPHHRVLWLERRLIRHLDGHEPAGARVEKRECHADLRGAQTAPQPILSVPHLVSPGCGSDHSRIFVLSRALSDGLKILSYRKRQVTRRRSVLPPKRTFRRRLARGFPHSRRPYCDCFSPTAVRRAAPPLGRLPPGPMRSMRRFAIVARSCATTDSMH